MLRFPFLFGMRHADFLDEDEATIDDLNADVRRQARAWLAARTEAGELPDLEPAMLWAIVFGPCRHWAGSWLRGTTRTTPEVAKRQIATAAYAGLQSLR